MKIDIYRSTKSGNKYLSVPEGTDVTKLNLPVDTDPDLLALSPFKTSLQLEPNMPRIALDQEVVIRQITERGFAIHEVKVEIMESPM